MRDLLLVLNCRRIPASLTAIDRLPIHKLWIRNLSESAIVRNWPQILELAKPYDRLIMVGDDSIPRLHALRAVQELGRHHPVVTGYSNLSSTDMRVNLTRSPLRGDRPTPEAYDLYELADLMESTQPAIRTWLTGLTLLCMPYRLWCDFPFDAYDLNGPGYGSDFHVSKRLDNAGVPIMAATDAFVWHHKRVWNEVHADTDERLLVGVEPAELVLETEREETVDRRTAVLV